MAVLEDVSRQVWSRCSHARTNACTCMQRSEWPALTRCSTCTKSIVHKSTVEFTLGGKTCDFHLALDDPQFNGMRFSHALRDAMNLIGTGARSGIWLFVAWAKVGRDRACHAQFMNLRATFINSQFEIQEAIITLNQFAVPNSSGDQS